jgi:hypothetical protein
MPKRLTDDELRVWLMEHDGATAAEADARIEARRRRSEATKRAWAKRHAHEGGCWAACGWTAYAPGGSLYHRTKAGRAAGAVAPAALPVAPVVRESAATGGGAAPVAAARKPTRAERSAANKAAHAAAQAAKEAARLAAKAAKRRSGGDPTGPE